jgi:type IV secretion system protein TrbJ
MKNKLITILYKNLLIFIFMIYPFAANANLPVIDFAALIQLGHQLMQLKQQTLYIQQQLKILDGDQYQWSNAQSLINQLASIVNQTNGIAYSAANANQNFKKAYPGYQAPENYTQQYKNNINMTQNTLNAILQSMRLNAHDFQNENSRLAFLQQQSQNARGQTQAIQASSQIASEMVSQIQLLRQTTIAQSNAQTAYYATQIQNEASSKAELEKIINAGSTVVPAYGSSGYELHAPDF